METIHSNAFKLRKYFLLLSFCLISWSICPLIVDLGSLRIIYKKVCIAKRICDEAICQKISNMDKVCMGIRLRAS